jgi:hypothetical protein
VPVACPCWAAACLHSIPRCWPTLDAGWLHGICTMYLHTGFFRPQALRTATDVCTAHLGCKWATRGARLQARRHSACCRLSSPAASRLPTVLAPALVVLGCRVAAGSQPALRRGLNGRPLGQASGWEVIAKPAAHVGGLPPGTWPRSRHQARSLCAQQSCARTQRRSASELRVHD